MDTLSRCPAFTSREGDTTAARPQTMLRKEQWLEVGAMELDDDDHERIIIGAIEMKQLLVEAKERIKEKAMLNEDCLTMCRQLSTGGRIDEHYKIKEDILSWKNRIYAAKMIKETNHGFRTQLEGSSTFRARANFGTTHKEFLPA